MDLFRIYCLDWQLMTEGHIVMISFFNRSVIIGVCLLQHTDCNGSHPQVLHCSTRQAWHSSQNAQRQGSLVTFHPHPSTNSFWGSTQSLAHWGLRLHAHLSALSVASASPIFFPTILEVLSTAECAVLALLPSLCHWQTQNCQQAKVCQITHGSSRTSWKRC